MTHLEISTLLKQDLLQQERILNVSDQDAIAALCLNRKTFCLEPY